MSICLRACMRVVRHARLPSYVPACLGSCLNVYMIKGRDQYNQRIVYICVSFIWVTDWPLTIHSVPVTTAFYSLGVVLNHWWINFWQFLSQPEWEHVWFKSACSNQIRQRKCSVFVCFRVSLCHSTLCAYTDVEHVHFRRVVPAFGTVYWHGLCGVNRTCWTIGSWRCCLCLNFVNSIPAGSATIWRLLCGL